MLAAFFDMVVLDSWGRALVIRLGGFCVRPQTCRGRRVAAGSMGGSCASPGADVEHYGASFEFGQLFTSTSTSSVYSRDEPKQRMSQDSRGTSATFSRAFQHPYLFAPRTGYWKHFLFVIRKPFLSGILQL